MTGRAAVRVWRQDANLLPLAIWMVLSIGAAVLLLRQGSWTSDHSLRPVEMAAKVGLLVVAPGAFAVYVWRARCVWVKVDPVRGLVVSSGQAIPWEAISRVKRRRSWLSRRFRIVEAPRPSPPTSLARKALPLLYGAGCFGIALFPIVLILALVSVVLAVFLFLFALAPALEVFGPFGERFVVETTSGQPLVLRDLSDADAFAAELRSRVPVVS